MSADDEGTKFQKGGTNDISEGPVKSRGCTDIPCCLLFVGHFVAFVYFASMGFANGNPERLVRGQDFTNQTFCNIGWDTSSNASGVLSAGTGILKDPKDFPLLYYTMNISTTVAELLKVVLPYTGNMDPAQIAADAAANVAAAKAQYDAAQAKLAAFTFPPDPATMMSGGNSSGGGQSLVSKLVNELNKYMNPVCVSSCPKWDVDASALASLINRQYQVTAADIQGLPLSAAEKTFYESVWASLVVGTPLETKFQFKALSKVVCPYDPQYCVPLSNVRVANVLGYYCMPEVPAVDISGGLNAVAGNGTLLGGVLSTAGLNLSWQSWLGDFYTSVDTLAIVAALSIIIGIIYLVLLRFLIGVLVWLSVLLSVLLLGAGGLVAFMYSRLCKDANLVASALTAAEGAIPSGECPGGFSIPDETARMVLTYTAYVVWGITALYILMLCCLRKRIQLGIAINKVGAEFVYGTPTVLLVPIVQMFFSLAWWTVWMVVAMYVMSAVSTTQAANGARISWDQDTQRSFAYIFFSLLWVNAFIIACGQCTIAGAAAVWYFCPPQDRLLKPAVMIGVKNCLRYHTGSMAFGAFVLAVVQFVKYWLQYLAKQAGAQHNKVMATVFWLLSYLVACFERCVKFLNKNAYIQVAVQGTGFCKSAMAAFSLIIRNAARFTVLGGIGAAVHFIGKVTVTCATAALGYAILWAMHEGDLTNPLGLVIIFVVMGWVAGSLVLSVFGLGVDTILQCFLADEEMNNGAAQHTPTQLRSFMATNNNKN